MPARCVIKPKECEYASADCQQSSITNIQNQPGCPINPCISSSRRKAVIPVLTPAVRPYRTAPNAGAITLRKPLRSEINHTRENPASAAPSRVRTIRNFASVRPMPWQPKEIPTAVLSYQSSSGPQFAHQKIRRNPQKRVYPKKMPAPSA